MRLPIYLDNMATTPVDPRVLDAMLPYLQGVFGNAASDHAMGQQAREAVEKARAQIASLIHADPSEIIFTSGATESDNLAIKGAVEAVGGGELITVATEHKAVLDSCHHLASQGCPITILPVGVDGLIHPDSLECALTPATVLVSIMAANNEIGVLQPMDELVRIAHEHGALFHTDAAQALGKIPIDVRDLPVDLMSLTAHKLYGPKGTGALYVRSGTKISPQMHGGGHEHGMRSGTLSVPGIVAFGEACRLAEECLLEESARLTRLRTALTQRLQAELDAVLVNGHPQQRLPGNLNVRFEGIDAQAVMADIPDIALSAGAACTSGSVAPSYVLTAIGLSTRQARASLRIGLGRFTTEEEINYVAGRLVDSVRRLRELSPEWE